METPYKLLHKTKYRELLDDAERDRLASGLRPRRRAGAVPLVLSLIGAAVVVLAVLLQVV
jgi:hypothetical protein